MVYDQSFNFFNLYCEMGDYIINEVWEKVYPQVLKVRWHLWKMENKNTKAT